MSDQANLRFVTGWLDERCDGTSKGAFEGFCTNHPVHGIRQLPLRRAITRIDSGTSVNAEGRPRTAGEAGVLKLSCLRGGVFSRSENKAVTDSERDRLAVPVRAG